MTDEPQHDLARDGEGDPDDDLIPDEEWVSYATEVGDSDRGLPDDEEVGE